jgi:hypothetical protein
MTRGERVMKRAFTAVLPFVALGLVLGCAGSEDTFRSTVAKRASFDMGCQQVSVQNIGGDSFGATGCERKASYSCVCTYHVWFSCTQAGCALDGASAPPPAR